MNNTDNQNISWISGEITVGGRTIPLVKTALDSADRFGSYKARWGIGRMRFRIGPGIYGVGNPTADSDVFVSANYKMSFDRLRSSLSGVDGWILVLDTKGINVWCAAGKGTFGTEEIVGRIAAVKLDEIVSHRKLILPQLGAPGVSAHRVREQSGFHIIYGPVRASDIPAFLKAGKKATEEMRQVKFPFKDRAVLIPNEWMQSYKYLAVLVAGFILLSGFGPDIYSFARVGVIGLISAVIIILSYILGVALPPLLLPWLPGRPFSLKGFWVGIVLAIIATLYLGEIQTTYKSLAGEISWLFIIPALVSFLAMNFTGCSTYTSLSGVKKEMRVAVPVQISLVSVGLILWFTGLFTGG